MTVVKAGHKSLSDYQRETLSLDVKPYHKEELDRLCKLLQTDSGFELIILQFNDPLYRDIVIEKTEAIEKKSYVFSVDISTFPTFQSFEEKIKDLGREYGVIHLTNLENWLFPPDSKSMIAGFNYHRESIAECKAKLLLWLTEPDIKAFAIDAPDMWSWRAAVLKFNVEKLAAIIEPPREPAPIYDLSLKERVKRINEIKEFLDKRPTDFSKNLHVVLLYELGLLFNSIGKYDEAMKNYRESLNTMREIGDRKGEAGVLTEIASIHKSWGKYDEAIKHLNESLKIEREIGDRVSEAITLNNIGFIYSTKGEREEAIKYFNDSLNIQRETNDRYGKATTLNNIGSIYYFWGKDDEAIKYFNETLVIMREIGDRKGEAITLGNIGEIYRGWGKYDEAIKYQNESLIKQREIGDRQSEAITLNNIGTIFNSVGKYDEAIRYYDESLRIRREVGDRNGEAITLGNIGEIYRGWGKYDQAIRYYYESLSIMRGIGNRGGEAIILWNIGMLMQNKNLREALDYFEEALALKEQLKHPDFDKDREFVETLRKKVKAQ